MPDVPGSANDPTDGSVPAPAVGRRLPPRSQRRAGEPSTQPRVRFGTRAVRLARDYLDAHVNEPVALEQLAGVAGVNKFSLMRAFAREVGCPPHAYHTRLRLARARSLIEGGAPLSHVAFDAGFADQSHLTRRFKALFGVTPGAYARSRAYADARARA